MRIRVLVPDVERVEMAEYDFVKLRKILEGLSSEYAERSRKLRDVRANRISPHAGIAVLGDPMVGRPTLGTEGVLWYRSLAHIGIRSYLRSKVGAVVDTLLYRAGKNLGADIVKRELSETPEIEEQLASLLSKIRELRIGVAKVLYLQEDYAQVRVDECISCAGMAYIEETVCYWEGGVLAGSLSQILNSEAEAVEYRCWGNGDETCEFDIFIGMKAKARAIERRNEIRRLIERGEKQIQGLGVKT